MKLLNTQERGPEGNSFGKIIEMYLQTHIWALLISKRTLFNLASVLKKMK